MSDSLQELFNDAGQDGLSQSTVGILVENLNALTVAGAQGVSIDELAGDEVTLFCAIIDETASMNGYRSTVVEAYNKMLEALKASVNSDSILMSTWFFNTRPRLIHGYQFLDKVSELTLSDYNPDGLTALFDATLHGLTSVVGYDRDLYNSGMRRKVVVVVFTDGEDNQSRNSAAHVKSISDDLLKKEIYHLALVAFGQGFAYQVAREMGFPNVLEVGASESDIRDAVGTVSASVIRVSQGKIGSGKSGDFFS